MRYLVLLVALLPLNHLQAAWDLVPDPPATKDVWTPQTGLALHSPTSSEFRFANGCGPFAMLETIEGAARKSVVHDLRTGQRVGEFAATGFFPLLALDPSGTIVAGVDFAKKRDVLLYDVRAKKELASVTLTREPSVVQFLSPERVLVLSNTPKPAVFTVIEARTGKVLKTWEHPVAVGTMVGVSPGGRYFATTMANTVVVFDTQEGKVQQTVTGPGICWGVAFSADGQQLAALTSRGVAYELMFWSLTEGTSTTGALPFLKTPPIPVLPVLQPLLAGGWLVTQQHVLDASGKLVKSWPQTGLLLPRIGLSTDVLVGLRRIEGLTGFALGLVSDAPQPVPLMPKFGDLPQGVAYPNTTPADLQNVRTIPVAPVPWGGALDPAPAPSRASPRELSLKQQLTRWHVSRDGQQACVETNSPTRYLVSLLTGEMKTAVWPQQFRVLGDSARGHWLTSASDTRVDLYDSAGQHIAGWNPTLTAKVIDGVALSSERVIIVTDDHRVTSWRLPACQAEWQAEVRSVTLACLSPGGQALVLVGSNAITVLDCTTGATKGQLPYAPVGLLNRTLTGGVAVRPDGKELVIALPDAAGTRLDFWNLETGQSNGAFVAPSITRRPVYIDHEHVALERLVVNVKRRMVVWQLQGSGEWHPAVHAPSDGRLWYSFKGYTTVTTTLVPGFIPVADYAAVAKMIADHPQALLKPGDPVRLDMQFAGPPIGLNTDARTKAESSLRNRGFVLDGAGPVVWKVTGTKKNTGRKVQITDVGTRTLQTRRPVVETFDEYDVFLSMSMERDGVVLWSKPESKHVMGLDRVSSTITIPDDNMTASEFLGRKAWSSALDLVGNPFIVDLTHAAMVDGEVYTLPGKSSLTATGITTTWPKNFVPQARPPAQGVLHPAETLGGTAPAEASGTPKWLWIVVAMLGMLFVGAVVIAALMLRPRPHSRPNTDEDEDDDDRPRRRPRR